MKTKSRATARRSHFEPLEPRILLSGDPFLLFAAEAAADLTLMVDDVNGVETLKLVDNETNVEVATKALHEIGDRGVLIQGSDGDDALRINLDRDTEIAGGIIFDAGAGNDRLIGSDTPNSWTINAKDSGRLEGAASISFLDVENLEGGDGADRFEVEHQISGTIDGGGGADLVNIATNAGVGFLEPLTADPQDAQGTPAGEIDDQPGTDAGASLLANQDIDSVTGLEQALRDGLAELQNVGDALDSYSELATSIPFVGSTIGDALDLGDVLQTQILDEVFAILDQATPDTDAIATALQSALTAIDGSATVIGGLFGNELTFDIAFQITKTVNLALDLGVDGSELGLTLSGGAAIDLDVIGTFDFTFGIDMTDWIASTLAITSGDFFLQLNDLSAGATITTAVPAFTVTFDDLPASLGVIGGTVQLDADVDITLDDGGDGKIDFSEITTGLGDLTSFVTLTPTGSLDAVLPLNGDLGVDLAQLGSPIVKVADADLFDGSGVSVTVDLDISTLKDQLLTILGEFSGLTSPLSDSVFFDIIDLGKFAGWGSVNDLIGDVGDLFDFETPAIDYFELLEVLNVDLSSLLGTFASDLDTLLGLGHSFSVGTAADLQALVARLNTDFGLGIPLGADLSALSAYRAEILDLFTTNTFDLSLAGFESGFGFSISDFLPKLQALLGLPSLPASFDAIRTDVLNLVGSFPSLDGLIGYLRDVHLGDFLSDFQGNLGFGPLSLSGGYFADVDELRIDVEFDASRIFSLPIEFGESGADLGLSVSADIDLDLGVNADFSVGVSSLTDQLAGSIESDDIFLRLRNLEVTADVDAPDLDISIDVGTDVGLSVVNGSFSLDAAVPLFLLQPGGTEVTEVTVADLALGGLGIFARPEGLLDVVLPISGNIGSFDATDFGSFVVRMYDTDTWDKFSPNVLLDVEIKSSLKDEILSILGELEDLGDDVNGLEFLNTKIPVIDSSLNDMANAVIDRSWGDLLKLRSTASDYFDGFDFATTFPTVKGLVDALTVNLNTISGDGLMGPAMISEPFKFAGGLDTTNSELRFDLDISAGSEILTELNLADLGAELGINIDAGLLLALFPGFELHTSFGLELASFLGGGGFSTSDVFLELRDDELSFEGNLLPGLGALVDFNISDIDVGFDLGLVSGSIVDGTLDVNLDVEAVLSGGGTRITLADLASSSVLDLLTFTPSGDLDILLPVQASFLGQTFGGAPDFPGVRILDTDLLDGNKPTISLENFTSFDDLLDLQGTGPQQILSLFLNLTEFLEQYRDSAVFDIEVPFVDADLGDVFDISRIFAERLNSALQTTDFFESGDVSNVLEQLGLLGSGQLGALSETASILGSAITTAGSLLTTTDLSTLLGGALSSVVGEDLILTRPDGAQVTVDLSAVTTVQELIDAVAHNSAVVTLTDNPLDGETLTINLSGQSATFEFDDNATVGAGNTAVAIGATVVETLSALIELVNSAPVGIIADMASDGTDPQLTLSLVKSIATTATSFTVGVTPAIQLAINAAQDGFDLIDVAGAGAAPLKLARGGTIAAIVAAFDTADALEQILQNALSSISGLPAETADVSIDFVSKELAIALQLGFDFLSEEFAVDLGLDLSPLGDVTANGTIALDAAAALGLTIGISLDFAASTAARDLGFADGASAASDTLTGSALVTTGSISPTTVLSSLNGGQGIEALVDGADLKITLRNGLDFEVDLGTPTTVQELIDAITRSDSRITINTNPSDGETLSVMLGSEAVVFEFDDDTSVTGSNILVDLGADAASTLVNLVAKLRDELDIPAGDSTGGGSPQALLRFVTAVSTTSAGLAISTTPLIALAVNAAGTGLELTDSSGGTGDLTVVSKTSGPTIFIEDASISGNVGLSVVDFDASANFGFVEIGVADASGSLLGAISLDLVNPGGGTRLTLQDLLSANPADLGVLSFTGSADLDLGDIVLSGGLLDALPGGLGDPGISISIPDLTALLDGVDSGDIVVTTDLPSLDDLRNLDFLTIIGGLRDVVSYLSTLQGFGFLDEQIPIINESVNDILDFVVDISTAIEEVAANPSGALDRLENELELALGIDPGLFDLRFEFDGTSIDALILDFQYGLSFNENLDFAADLEALGALAGEPAASLLAGISSFVDVGGGASLQFTGSATLDIEFGIDLSTPSSPVPFLTDATGITLGGAIRGTGINFDASVGPLGIFVRGGSLAIDGDADATTTADSLEIGFGLIDGGDGDADGRYTLTEILGAGSISSIVGTTLSGGLKAELPIFFPVESIALSPALTIEIADIFGFLQDPGGVPGQVQITTPDLSSLLTALNPLILLTDPSVMVDGFDTLLGAVQTGLNGAGGALDGLSLPVVGDAFKDASNFIGDFRADVVSTIRDAIEGVNPVELLQQSLYDLLREPVGGEGGTHLGILRDSTDPSLAADSKDDVVITLRDTDGLDTGGDFTDQGDVFAADAIQLNVNLGQDLFNQTVPIDFDLGLDGLPLSLEVMGGINFMLGWDIRLGFGVSVENGFYFDTSADNELEIGFDITIPGFDATGRLFFLEATAADSAGDPSSFSGGFSLDLNDPGIGSNDDGRLTLTEMLGPKPSGFKLIDPSLGAVADINLELVLGLGSATFPNIVADLGLDWNFDLFDTNVGFQAPTISFTDVGLSLGTFLSNFVGPIVEKVEQVLGPLRPVLDAVNAPIPVLSDIAGQDVTLITLPDALLTLLNAVPGFFLETSALSVFFTQLDTVLGFIDTFNTILGSINTVGDEVIITMGDFIVGGDPTMEGSTLSPTPTAQNSNQDSQIASSSAPSNVKGFVSNLRSSPLQFPFLTEPTQIFNLLLGQDIDLFLYDSPRLFLDLRVDFSFPVWPFPLVTVDVNGNVQFDAQFNMGYDTVGLRSFIDSGNPLDIIDGFFVGDTRPKAFGNPGGDGNYFNQIGQQFVGPVADIPELFIGGSLQLGLEFDAILARAGASGGITFMGSIDLNDPNNDGRIRPSEMAAIIAAGDGVSGFLDLFNISVMLSANASVYVDLIKFIEVEVGTTEHCVWGVCVPWIDVEVRRTFNRVFTSSWASGKFVNWTHGSPTNIEPALASKQSDDSLLLHIGTNAAKRLVGNKVDGNEAFTVKHISGSGTSETVEVSFNGITQTYSGIDKIVANAGAGNDSIVLDGVLAPSDLTGGTGNDRLELKGAGALGSATLRGGKGNDTLLGGSAADMLFGDDGTDLLEGRGGGDVLEGGLAADTLRGQGGNDTLRGGAGNDLLEGGDNNDTLEGDADFDTLKGGSGNDTLRGGSGNDQLFGEAGGDQLFGDAGGDFLDGGSGNDILRGGEGSDTLQGGTENDQLFGEGNGDTLRGGAGSDTLDGGSGADRLFGDGEADELHGGSEGDTLDGGTGNDQLFGDGGNDLLEGQAGDDTLHGGIGQDTLFGHGNNDQLFGEDGADSLAGGDGDDLVVGGDGPDVLLGDNGIFGSVTLTGGVGNDTLLGGNGDDEIYGQGGDDRLLGEADNDELFGGDDNDDLIGGLGADDLAGEGGNDDIVGDEGDVQTNSIFSSGSAGGADTILGGVGNDNIIGGGGADDIFGEAGLDIILGDFGTIARSGGVVTSVSTALPSSGGRDTISGGSADDVILGGSGAAASLQPVDSDEPVGLGNGGSPFDLDFVSQPTTAVVVEDVITGGDNDDVLLGDHGTVSFSAGVVTTVVSTDDASGGDDLIDGNDGSDVLIGGAGSDTLSGNLGDDAAIGDSGDVDFTAGVMTRVSNAGRVSGGAADTISGDENNDILLGGLGGDGLTGNDGADLLLGDNGTVNLDAAGTPTDAASANDTTGGADDIAGNDGADLVIGGAGGDTIAGNLGADGLIGDSGDILLASGIATRISNAGRVAGGGADTISGDENNDVVLGGQAGDTISGNLGDDSLLGDNGTVDLDTSGVVTAIASTDDTTGGADDIQGDDGADIILGGADGDTLRGNLGDDVVIGDSGDVDLTAGVVTRISNAGRLSGGGADTISGNEDDDIVLAGNAGDTVTGNLGADIVLGDNGTVDLDAAGVVASIISTDDTTGGADDIQGNAGADIILGGADGDTLTGDLGDDVVIGDSGDVDFTAGVATRISNAGRLSGGGVDQISGDGDDDIVLAGMAGDVVTGDLGDDILLGDNGTVLLVGGAVTRITSEDSASGGADDIQGNEGEDILLGGQNNDTLAGNSEDDVLLGDNGVVVRADGSPEANDIFTIAPGDGGVDTISGDDGNDIVLGGALGDGISGGLGADLILGDHGYVARDAADDVLQADTTNPDQGGADTIDGNEGGDYLVGGMAGDTVYGSAGDDFLLGDNAHLDFALDADLSTLDLAESTDPTDGGADTLRGDGDKDHAFGGTGNDDIGGGDDHDVLLGDHGRYDTSLPANQNFLSIFVTNLDGGGVDLIHGDDGDDFILGQQAGDILFGDADEDDLTGGHNVLFGADGDDLIDGGSEADVMIGDNGTILRHLLEGEDCAWETWAAPAPFDDVIRDVQLFDNVDMVGGDDTMLGGGGDDIIHGQRGNDDLDGGTGDDELFGELGDDSVAGGDGNDTMIGNVGTVLRAFNDDGTPRFDDNGSWHRDVFLEDTGVVTDSVDVSGSNALAPNLAAKLIEADLIVLAGGFDLFGSKLVNGDGAWETRILLIDLVDVNHDFFDGGGGEDNMFGHRGNDTMLGGPDNDLIFGDGASNLVPYATEIPHIFNGLRIIGNGSSAGLDLDFFGSVIVPQLTILPAELSLQSPFLLQSPIGSLLPGVVHGFIAELGAGALRMGASGDVLRPYATIVPDALHHAEVLAGNDVIDGGSGDDLIVGDYASVYSPLLTDDDDDDDDDLDSIDPGLVATANGTQTSEFAQNDASTSTQLPTDDDDDDDDDVLQRSLRDAWDALDSATYGLRILGYDYDQYQHEVLGEQHTHDISIGNDDILGGLGNDLIYGDNAQIIGTFTFGIPVEESGYLAANLELHDYIRDLELLATDLDFAVFDAHHDLLGDLIAAATPVTSEAASVGSDAGGGLLELAPSFNSDVDDSDDDDDDDSGPLQLDPDYHDLLIGNDTIAGGAGRDQITGDDGTVVLARITGQRFHDTNQNVSSTVRQQTELALESQDQVRLAELAQHVALHHVPAAEHAAADLQSIGWDFAPELFLGNDVIFGGDDADLLVGDFSFIALPILSEPLPEGNSALLRDVKHTLSDIEGWLNKQYHRLHQDRPEFHEWQHPHYDLRGGADTAVGAFAGNDVLNGEGGDDFIIGDSFADVVALLGSAPDQDLGPDDGDDDDDNGLDFKVKHMPRRSDELGPHYGGDADDDSHSDADLSDGIQSQGAATAGIVDFGLGAGSAVYDLTDDDDDDDNGMSQDTISGGLDNDILYGQEAADVIDGDEGNDTIFGGPGPDTLNGGPGVNKVKNGGPDVAHGDFRGALQDSIFASTAPWLRQLVEDQNDAAVSSSGPAEFDPLHGNFIGELVLLPSAAGDPGATEADSVLDSDAEPPVFDVAFGGDTGIPGATAGPDIAPESAVAVADSDASGEAQAILPDWVVALESKAEALEPDERRDEGRSPERDRNDVSAWILAEDEDQVNGVESIYDEIDDDDWVIDGIKKDPQRRR